MSDSALPKPAATLVILRPEAAGFSVLLMQRPSKSSFMGGMHVFPGGKVEPGDRPAAAGELGRRLARPMGLGEPEAEAYATAVFRETFEEMGILPQASGATLETLRQARKAMADGTLSWREWPHAAVSDEVEIGYFDHWITPEVEPRRFDTRFFVTMVSPAATPEPNREAIAWAFLSPQEALAQIASGAIAMAPPTLVTMQRLAAFKTASEAVRGLGQRKVSPLQPELASADPLTLALPGHPAHTVSERTADNPTAIVMQDGKWKIIWD